MTDTHDAKPRRPSTPLWCTLICALFFASPLSSVALVGSATVTLARWSVPIGVSLESCAGELSRA